jgi:hypothetical protein
MKIRSLMNWGLTPILFAAAMSHAQEDPNLWLEDVTGEKALAW